jgi:hypothetical protein
MVSHTLTFILTSSPVSSQEGKEMERNHIVILIGEAHVSDCNQPASQENSCLKR